MDEEKNKKFQCLHVGCSKLYSSKSSRTNHMKKCTFIRKSPRKSIKCDSQVLCKFCNKAFYHHASIYRHQQICNAARLSEGKDPIQKPVRLSKTFNCDICFKTFKRIGHLTVHMKTHSEDNIKYCNTCGKRFKRSDHFKKTCRQL